MARPLIVIAAFLSLAVSAAIAAPPADKGKPEKNKPAKSESATSQAADENAAKKCKAERGTTAATIAAFKEKYGTNHNKANAFGKCVSGQMKKAKTEAEQEDEAAEEKAEDNAAKKCKAERGTTPATIAAFKEKYGTNHNKANAFGKCVSKLAKAQTS